MEGKPKCTSCEEAKLQRLKNEAIQRESGGEGLLDESENFYSDPRHCGDQPRNELKEGCVFAMAAIICIPMLVMFTLVVVVVTVARGVGEISDWILR